MAEILYNIFELNAVRDHLICLFVLEFQTHPFVDAVFQILLVKLECFHVTDSVQAIKQASAQ